MNIEDSRARGEFAKTFDAR